MGEKIKGWCGLYGIEIETPAEREGVLKTLKAPLEKFYNHPLKLNDPEFIEVQLIAKALQSLDNKPLRSRLSHIGPFKIPSWFNPY